MTDRTIKIGLIFDTARQDTARGVVAFQDMFPIEIVSPVFVSPFQKTSNDIASEINQHIQHCVDTLSVRHILLFFESPVLVSLFLGLFLEGHPTLSQRFPNTRFYIGANTLVGEGVTDRNEVMRLNTNVFRLGDVNSGRDLNEICDSFRALFGETSHPSVILVTEKDDPVSQLHTQDARDALKQLQYPTRDVEMVFDVENDAFRLTDTKNQIHDILKTSADTAQQWIVALSMSGARAREFTRDVVKDENSDFFTPYTTKQIVFIGLNYHPVGVEPSKIPIHTFTRQCHSWVGYSVLLQKIFPVKSFCPPWIQFYLEAVAFLVAHELEIPFNGTSDTRFLLDDCHTRVSGFLASPVVSSPDRFELIENPRNIYPSIPLR